MKVPRQSFSESMLLDRRMSLAPRGLLVAILSQPAGFQFSVDWAVSEFRCGRDKIKSLLRELTKCGYLRVDRGRFYGKFSPNVWSFTDEARAEGSRVGSVTGSVL